MNNMSLDDLGLGVKIKPEHSIEDFYKKNKTSLKKHIRLMQNVLNAIESKSANFSQTSQSIRS